MINAKRRKFFKYALLVTIDLLIVAVAMLSALLLTDGSIKFDVDLLIWFILNAVALVGSFWALGVYRMYISEVSVIDALRLVFGVGITLILNVIYSLAFGKVGLGAAVVFSLITLSLVGAERFLFRIISAFSYALHIRLRSGAKVLIVGAGKAGSALLREIQSSDKITYRPVCFVDDDETKIGSSIGEVPVKGAVKDVPYLCERYSIEQIFIAIPSATREQVKAVLDVCKTTRCKIKTLPGIYQLANGEVSVKALRDVDIQDLLGREQVKVNLDDIMGYIENQVVLVTGGGGSIGSELCRQIATHNPKQLIILDIYENNAYDIEQELKRNLPTLNLLTLIASVRDKGKIEDVFNKYRPNIVFNAAAHKHVPLMETSPNEAVKNNVFGTLNVARCADKYKVKTFVQISTDKAVNPTNVMGATKRICEMIIQAIGKKSSDTKFVAVRFGNVLGSNGSVIPLFKKQIKEGGPVTVTHKDIIRYFMTIPEAVSLVLQAGAYAKEGQIFVLDMGEPVRIYDLAYNLIKLSGLEPNVDIELKCTGLRPGEKLYEERLMAEEGLQKTPNGLINIANPIEFDEQNLWTMLDKLYAAAYAETSDMKRLVAQLVPTYKIDQKD